MRGRAGSCASGVGQVPGGRRYGWARPLDEHQVPAAAERGPAVPERLQCLRLLGRGGRRGLPPVQQAASGGVGRRLGGGPGDAGERGGRGPALRRRVAAGAGHRPARRPPRPVQQLPRPAGALQAEDGEEAADARCPPLPPLHDRGAHR